MILILIFEVKIKGLKKITITLQNYYSGVLWVQNFWVRKIQHY
jgi:hypothetical protein